MAFVHAHHHDHQHGHAHTHASPLLSSRQRLGYAALITLVFAAVEYFAGQWAGSLSLIADAGHMAGDFLALGLAFFAATIALRPPDAQRTYGYRRAEVLGALANAALLLFAAAGIIFEAIERISSVHPVHGLAVVVVAALGLAVNLLVAAMLWHASEGIGARSALFHVMSDALGSIAALVAGLVIWFTGWLYADLIASLAIALLIGGFAFSLLRQSLHVLMEGAPRHLDIQAVSATIATSHGVQAVHDLHLWELSNGDPILSAHVVIGADSHGTEVVQLVNQRLRALHGIAHSTIQPEVTDRLVTLRRERSSGEQK